MPKILDDSIYLVSASNQALPYGLAGFKQASLVFSFLLIFFFRGEDGFSEALRVVQRAETRFVGL